MHCLLTTFSPTLFPVLKLLTFYRTEVTFAYVNRTLCNCLLRIRMEFYAVCELFKYKINKIKFNLNLIKFKV